MRTSCWWTESNRIHVAGSFGEIRIAVHPESRLVDIDDELAHEIHRLLDGGDRNPGDLQYVALGKLPVDHLALPDLEIEIERLQAVDRALVEHVDLCLSNILIRADKLFDRKLQFGPQFLHECAGKLIQFTPRIVLFHRVIPSHQRLKIRERAAWRARMVDEALAMQSARRDSQYGAVA